MLEILSQDAGLLALLFIAGALSFAFAILTGGGGALLLIPVCNVLIGTAATAPVVNLGNFIGRPVRLYLFWQHIDWRVVRWYAPFALVGATLAGFLFSKMNLPWLQALVGIFLISTIFQYRFGKQKRSFNMPLWGFAPLALIVSALGTLIGALGPVLNPFMLNAGLTKEDLVATKTANSFFMGLAQIGSYTFFGLLTAKLVVYGIALGLGAALGSFFGKKMLKSMTAAHYQKWLIGFMVASGVLMIWQAVG